MKLFLKYIFILTLSLSLLFISGCNRSSDKGGVGRIPVPSSKVSDRVSKDSDTTKEEIKKEENGKTPSTTQNSGQSTQNQSPSNNSGEQKKPATIGDNKDNTNTPPSSGQSSSGQSSSGTGSNTGTDESTTPNSSANEGAPSLPSLPSNHGYEFSAEVEEKILSLINAERSNAGVVSLSANGTLRSAARYKANEMLQYDYFSHNSPYSKGPSDIAKAYGHTFNTFGENLYTMSSSNQSSLRENISVENIVFAWMASEGHRSNILNSNYRRTGIGVVIGTNGKCYISQMFSD
ncbi:CAP domain-containing protein [Alloiococcus sp. CFN-8]|uniref:CAP domain-containing protein n=1 Tax=Alloiococcus sp. CFN-8 TaxID=3416081 RepID=UPI003CFA6F8C